MDILVVDGSDDWPVDLVGNVMSAKSFPDLFTMATGAAAPTYTATWLDNGATGDINRLQLDFSTAVTIDDQDGTGFNAITLSSGSIVEADYSDLTGTATQLVLTVSGIVSTSIRRVRKPSTMFYNRLPYHNYDIVINPEI